MRVPLLLAFVVICLAGGVAAAHPPPPPCCDVAYEPPPPPPDHAPKARTVWEAQLGGGLGRYAAGNEQWLGFSIGYHRVLHRTGWQLGNEVGADLDLRFGAARDGSSIIIGVRPVARRIDGDWRTPSLLGLVLPELAWSAGDGRQRALRIEWSAPIAISIGRDGLEWDIVRGGAIFADDGVHASLGTELRFVLR